MICCVILRFIKIIATFFYPNNCNSQRRHKDGERVRGSRDTSMSLCQSGVARLSVGRATARHSGVYSLSASNEVGSVISTARVGVHTAPVLDEEDG